VNSNSEFQTISDNGCLLQLPPVVDDGNTASFSKEASHVTTNRWTPKSAKSNKLPPEFYALQQSAEIREHTSKGSLDDFDFSRLAGFLLVCDNHDDDSTLAAAS
jgi:hypothetical protein